LPSVKLIRVIFLDCRVKRTSPLHGSGTFTFQQTWSGSPSFRINSAAERAIRAAFRKFCSLFRAHREIATAGM